MENQTKYGYIHVFLLPFGSFNSVSRLATSFRYSLIVNFLLPFGSFQLTLLKVFRNIGEILFLLPFGSFTH